MPNTDPRSWKKAASSETFPKEKKEEETSFVTFIWATGSFRRFSKKRPK